MDNNEGLVIYEPDELEITDEYIQRYTSEEFQEILNNPYKYKRLLAILHNLSAPRCNFYQEKETRSKLIKLSAKLQNTVDYNVLLQRKRLWVDEREKLLKKLSECNCDLSWSSKFCKVGRMIGCFAEISCTIAGLCIISAKKYAESSLHSATFFGFFGFFCTCFYEQIPCRRLNSLLELIEIEKKSFGSIEEWFNRHKELRTEMENVFEFEFKREMEEYIKEGGMKYFSRIIFLLFLFSGFLQSKLGELNIFDSLKTFLSHLPWAEIFIKIYSLQTEENVYEILKMFLQHWYVTKHPPVYQSIRALPEPEQKLLSIPVSGRLLLNGMSFFVDGLEVWRNDAPRVHQLQAYEVKMKEEMEVMNEIVQNCSIFH